MTARGAWASPMCQISFRRAMALMVVDVDHDEVNAGWPPGSRTDVDCTFEWALDVGVRRDSALITAGRLLLLPSTPFQAGCSVGW